MKNKEKWWKPDDFWIDAIRVIILGFMFEIVLMGLTFIIFRKDAPEFVYLCWAICWTCIMIVANLIIVCGLIKQIIEKWKE